MTDAYLYEIRSIDEELKRLRDRTRNLNSLKKQAQERLYNLCIDRGIEIIDGKSIEKLRPKEKVVRVPKKQRDSNIIQTLREIGVPDPVSLYDQLKVIQKGVE